MCIPFRQFSNLLADTYYISFNQGTANDCICIKDRYMNYSLKGAKFELSTINTNSDSINV
jgi:hypothetical protein